MAFAVVSALGAAYGAYTQYEAQQAQAKQQENMAEAAERNAQHAAEAAANKSEQERLNRESQRKEDRSQMARRRSIQEAMYAKSGILLDGTPSDYLVEQAGTDELNIQRADQASQMERTNILYQGNRQSGEYMNQSNSLKFAAKISKSSAQNSLIGGVFGAASAGASTYSQMGGKFSWETTPAATGSFTGLTSPSSLMNQSMFTA